MITYRALKKQRVQVWNGDVEVKAGELVNFATDPGEGWEEVSSGSNTRQKSGTVGDKRSGIRDN